MTSKKNSKQAYGSHTKFFWEKPRSGSGKSSKSRFSLLLLDYGEYLMEDLSAFYFPIPTSDLSRAFELSDALKVQGRLKLCSRSLIFEPAELRFPIMKFPYKSIRGSLEDFRLKPSEIEQLSVDLSANSFFTYCSTAFFQMKENNKVGPYKAMEFRDDPNQNAGGCDGHRVVFALVHAELSQFLVKVEQLRHIYTDVHLKQGSAVAQQLLKPFIETAQLWTLNSFDTSQLVSFHEQMLFDQPIAVRKIRPLTMHPGSLMVTDSRVYFQPSQLNNIGGESIMHLELRQVSRVFKRRYQLRQTALELLLADGSSHLFAFDATHVRDYLYDTIVSQPALRRRQPQGGAAWLSGAAYSNNDGGASSSSCSSSSVSALEDATRRWQRRELSNFEYLMLLNSEADRSVNDLAQYPVFPHIISDFSSRRLDLQSSNTYRDLSKPVGALNPERLSYFKERFSSMPPADPSSGLPPPFLYGTHYSTPGYVLYYLVRVAPEYMLCLQNGKFDAADRMFYSVQATWESCLHNPADLKELIPEFFTGSGEFLVNFDDLDLGHRHTGQRLGDVELPPWADSPRDFIRKNAKALESEHVSAHLHEWIDLIFGYKQQGEEAVRADNLYYHVTYEGAIDLDKVPSPRERDALILQIQEFGQTPKQLFRRPHPCRNDAPQASQAARTDSSGPPHSSFVAASRQSKSRQREMMGEDVCGRSPDADGFLDLDYSSGPVAVSPGSASGKGTDASIGDEDLGSVAIVHLDDAFKRQVALELELHSAEAGAGVARCGTSSSFGAPYKSPEHAEAPSAPAGEAPQRQRIRSVEEQQPAQLIVVPPVEQPRQQQPVWSTPASLEPAAPPSSSGSSGVAAGVGGRGSILDSVFSWSRSTAATFLASGPSEAAPSPGTPVGSTPPTVGEGSRYGLRGSGGGNNVHSHSDAMSNRRGSAVIGGGGSWSPLRRRGLGTGAAPAEERQRRATDDDVVARFRRPVDPTRSTQPNTDS